ncbi:ribose ABC superfamily ATP-binding protein [Paenibacillus tyrfis]|uniref:ABC transporter substrate-binding protein n=1 Tax=Paenibacillus tyrfis TaxID=1501230 RepID=UPI002492C09A|nr:ABC transporter substrate-binding protein [Paenibacillus tyrfis]GLI04859.1 ribose ABC superfamily ATP-binding protein [Paenibacillus tyrfis]
MKSFKFLSFVLLAYVLLLSACSIDENKSVSTGEKAESSVKNGAASGKKLKIGMTVPTLGNPFFVAMSKGAQEAANKYNADITVVSADHDLAKQTQQFEDFITQKVDLILLSPFDSKGIAAAIQQAKAAGIPVVALDGSAEGGIDTVVMSDNVQAGKLAAEYLAKRLNGKGNLVIIDGPPVSAVTDRIKGFEDTLKNYPDIKVISKQNGEGNRERSLSLMENIMQANKKIDAVFCINDEEGLGVKIAQEQAGRTDEFFIVGVDGAPIAVDALKEKKSYAATSAQFPNQIAIEGIELALKVIQGEKVDPQVLIPTQLITQDNVGTFQGW